MKQIYVCSYYKNMLKKMSVVAGRVLRQGIARYFV